MLIKIRREIGLDAEEWSFVVIDEQIVLQDYARLTRPTKRHKEQCRDWYDRLNTRDCKLKLDEVPLPQDVADEALRGIQSKFRVVREYKR